MAQVIRFPIPQQQIDQFGFYYDFEESQSDTKFLKTVPNSGTAVVSSTLPGGVMVLTPSGGSPAANDEAYLSNPNSIFLPKLGKPMSLLSKLQFVEANTNQAGVAVGFASSVAAGLIANGVAAMRTTGTVICIVKFAGSNNWTAISQCNGVTNSTLTNSPAGGTTQQELGIQVLDYTSTLCQIAFLLNGKRLRDANNKDFVQSMVYASAVNVAGFVGVKNGSSSKETVNLDLFSAWQKR